MFDSSRMFGLFKTYFDEELYRYAASYYDNKPFGRERLLYAIVGIARVLEGVEISKRNRPPHEDIIRSLSEDFGEHYDDAQILRKFKDYFTATISVKLTAAGDLQIFSVSDNRAAMMKPTWLQKDGVCYIISSYSGNLEFVAKVFAEGSIQLSLLGFPCAIDYTKLTIDGQRLFDKLTPIRRDDFRCYEITNIKAGTEIKIEVEWLPHRSDT